MMLSITISQSDIEIAWLSFPQFMTVFVTILGAGSSPEIIVEGESS